MAKAYLLYFYEVCGSLNFDLLDSDGLVKKSYYYEGLVPHTWSTLEGEQIHISKTINFGQHNLDNDLNGVGRTIWITSVGYWACEISEGQFLNGMLHGFGRRIKIAHKTKTITYKLGYWQFDELHGFGERVHAQSFYKQFPAEKTDTGVFRRDRFLGDKNDLDLEYLASR